METILLKRKKLDFNEFIKRRAQEEDCPITITEPTTLLDEEGNLIAIYGMVGTDVHAITHAVMGVKYDINTRTGGLKTTSRIFGYRPRNVIRNDFCSVTSLALESPNKHRVISELARIITERYKSLAPEVFNKHAELLKETIKEEWVIPGSIFTSGIINKNNPLKYHFDTGNFDKVFSCMLMLRHNVVGGYLCLPEFDVKFLLKNESLFMFDGQGILHGVTPMKIAEDGYRYSLVYYSLKQMWNCLIVDEEIARIRNKKTEREINRRNGNKLEPRKA